MDLVWGVCVNPYFVASSLSRSLFSASCKTLNVGCKIFRFKQLVRDFLPSVHSDIVMKLILKCTTLDLKIVCVVECSSVKKFIAQGILKVWYDLLFVWTAQLYNFISVSISFPCFS